MFVTPHFVITCVTCVTNGELIYVENSFRYEDVKNRPISQTELYGMTASDQVSYIKNLANTFNASCPMISDMLKMNPGTLRSHMYSLGYNFTKTGKKSSSNIDEWERFCGINVVADGYIASDNSISQSDTIDETQKNDSDDFTKSISNYNDKVAAMNMFFEETCIISEDHLKTKFDVIKEIYRLWCNDNGFSSFSSKEFCEVLKSEYKSTFTKKSGYIYCDNIFLKMNVLKDYRNRIYCLKSNESPYYNPKPSVDTAPIVDKPNYMDKHKNRDKKFEIKHSNNSFVMIGSSGTYNYEGIPSEIFSDVSTKLDNKKMRIKIEWEVI